MRSHLSALAYAKPGPCTNVAAQRDLAEHWQEPLGKRRREEEGRKEKEKERAEKGSRSMRRVSEASL